MEDSTGISIDYNCVIDDDWAGYTVKTLKFVIVYNEAGDYIVHGNNEQTPSEMFKAVAPLWSLDPSCEQAQYMEVNVELPVIAKLSKPRLGSNADNS